MKCVNRDSAIGQRLFTLGMVLIGMVLILGATSYAQEIPPAEAADIPAKPDPVTTAQTIDASLSAELDLKGQVAERTDDATFLRRVTLDLIGRNPTVAEITAFTLDPATDKRANAVARLLASNAYGQNWARYWRDVIMYRRSEDRALLSQQALTTHLADSFNQNKPWSELAASFLTAEGDVAVNGATGLIMAQNGRPEETTAEVARIFLGIQIQCAQCHDHPTDSWKREQFHELTAFFSRIAVRQVMVEERRTFQVVVNDASSRFGFAPGGANRFRGTPEHYMPDLDNPTARGKLMTPKFFLTGESIRLGTKDAERRGTLAEWMTDNEWFSKAIVNRLWSELVGEGFYEPVDDMGPDRTCHAPKTLDQLSAAFTASGHDLKWLFTTITATEAYQRNSQGRRSPDQAPFAANVPQRLRADQVSANITAVLGATTSSFGRGRGGPGGGLGGFRNPLAVVFGYDPSTPRDEVAGSIPQALAMMNSPQVNQGISARGRTSLARLVSTIKDDRELISEIYLKTLAREPSESEITTCLHYLEEVGNRSDAIEDIQWALVNSTEFLHRK